jgi:type IV secretion system protein VirB4
MNAPRMDRGVGLSEYVPISSHVHPRIVRTRGGDYLSIWQMAGLAFLGREEWDIRHRHTSFNRLLQTLRAPDYTNVAYWCHDIRRRRPVHFDGVFNDAFTQGVNDRYMKRLNEGKVLVNELYFTLIFRPEGGNRLAPKATKLEQIIAEQEADIGKMLELGNNVEAALVDYQPRALGCYENENGQVFSEVYEFFGFLLNHTDEKIPVLEAPAWSYLPTSTYAWSANNGNYCIRTSDGQDHFGAILDIKEYPEETFPGVLNSLKYLPCEYIITHSFAPLARQDALSALKQIQNRLISSGDRSVTQIEELNKALDGVSSGNFLLGDYHFSLAAYCSSVPELNSTLPLLRSYLSQAGFVSAKQTIASAAASYAQLPANFGYRTRKSKLSSLNFLGLTPLHNFALGKRDENPWGQAVSVLQSTNGQPYFFNFHATGQSERSFGEMALANTMVIGKSGTGKTALVNFLLCQVQRYDPSPTIFFFDKDRGAEIFVRACNGHYFTIESGKPTGLNPFQCENTEGNRMFLIGLIKLIVGKPQYTAREDDDIARAVAAILDAPPHLRSIANLRNSFPNTDDNSIYARLRKWSAEGYLGWVFDNEEDKISFGRSNVIGFDYTDLIDSEETRVPIIVYLLFRLEQLIDGRPLVFVMDEFWKILDGEGGLKEFARNKLKTIRKQNGFGVFATQSPEDALKSDISAALVEQTATLILLPNPNASKEDYIDGLKLTEAEFKEVVELDERSRCFLVKQGQSSVLCQLQLGGLPDVLSVLSASTGNIEIMHEVIRDLARARFHPTQPLAEPTGEELNAIRSEEWLPIFHKRTQEALARKRLVTSEA